MKLEILSPQHPFIVVRLPRSWWKQEWFKKDDSGAEEYGGPTFFCRGTDDAKYQRAIAHDSQRQATERAAEARRRRESGDAGAAFAAALLERSLEDLVPSTNAIRCLVKDWRAFDADGEPVPFDDREFRELFEDDRLLPDQPPPFYEPRRPVGEALRKWVVNQVAAETARRKEAQALGEDGYVAGENSS